MLPWQLHPLHTPTSDGLSSSPGMLDLGSYNLMELKDAHITIAH